ncbi:MAG: protein TolQ [Proteobacteria bacterium]|nr:protein TolQ [Pseudomonadota bacterium]
MNMLHLVAEASLFAQLILLVLLVLLYLSLWFILRKRRVLKDYEDKCNAFEKEFWAGGDISVLEERVRSREFGDYGLAQIFLFGQEEFKKACEIGGENVELILEGVRRALDISIQNEETRLNRHMQFLATVSGVSPYIGLLGTVWGIINAFQSLAQTSQATIALVAPGIAEALIATAMGLLAAIPALIAYNYFSGRLESLGTRFDNFANHYLNILHRNL